MDDFRSAYPERALDTMALHNTTQKKRMVAAVHVGGITIECILKYFIMWQHGIKKWGEISKRNGKKIETPSHNLLKAIDLVDGLRPRLDANRVMFNNVKILQNPSKRYIDMRYQGSSTLSEVRYNEWFLAYDAFKKWLLEQQPHLPK